MARKIIGSLGTVASIISLVFIQQIHIAIRAVVALLGIASAAILLWGDIKSNKENEKVCGSEEEIKAVMKSLVKTQGKIHIMSRDLSWVDSEIEGCIKDKKGNITLFVEHETELTKRLELYGANIKYYGALGFEPKTRFTVIGYNRNNPQVAIASTQHTIRKPGRFKHVIYETSGNSSLDRSLTSLAIDMVDLVLKAGETKTQKGGTDLAQSTAKISQ